MACGHDTGSAAVRPACRCQQRATCHRAVRTVYLSHGPTGATRACAAVARSLGNAVKVSRPVRIFAWALIIGSFPMWVIAITATPFFPLPAAQRVIAATVIAVSGEAMFWIGGAILGAAVVAKFRRPKVTTGRSFAGRRVAVIGATGGLGRPSRTP